MNPASTVTLVVFELMRTCYAHSITVWYVIYCYFSIKWAKDTIKSITILHQIISWSRWHSCDAQFQLYLFWYFQMQIIIWAVDGTYHVISTIQSHTAASRNVTRHFIVNALFRQTYLWIPSMDEEPTGIGGGHLIPVVFNAGSMACMNLC